MVIRAEHGAKLKNCASPRSKASRTIISVAATGPPEVKQRMLSDHLAHQQFKPENQSDADGCQPDCQLIQTPTL